MVTNSYNLQNPERCSSTEARAFDFWIGNWDIDQKLLQQDGTWLNFDAKTSVSFALDGCAIIEHWDGMVQFFWEGMQDPEPMKALSVRSFDAQTGKWLIYWMDSRTPNFGTPYIGGFSKDNGEFFREWEVPQGKRIGRITFSNITPDSVGWELAVSSDERQTWSAIWIMEMHRTEKGSV
jgi:hypothetical protein